MIKSIVMKNFQSHKDTTVLFCDGINAIVGLSDSGKTSILRAIDWVVNNKPSGEEFISSWSEETSVTITLDNGIVVTRGRSPSDNYYMIDDEEFRAFGVHVPVEIKNVMNMEHINIEKQLDPPFLLGSSPGEVAQILNQIVDLGGIDCAISNIRKEKMKADQEYRTEKTRWEESVEQLKQYDYLAAMEKDVTHVQVTIQHIEDTHKKIKQINKLIKDMKQQQDLMNESACTLVFEDQIIHCQTQYDKLKTDFRKKTTINNLLKIWDSNNVEVEKHKKIIKNDANISTCLELVNDVGFNNKALNSINALLDAHESTKKEIEQQSQILENEQFVHEGLKSVDDAKIHYNKLKSINVLLDNIEAERKKQLTQNLIIEKLEKKYATLFPDVCPLCGVSQ